MSEMRVFTYGEQRIRTAPISGAMWWVLTDVCQVLGLKEPHRVAARLDEDERMTCLLNTGHTGRRVRTQRLIVVSESGLYAVMLRSDKPEAKAFKRWVTQEVLPAVRETGTYAAPAPTVPVAAPVVPELPADARLARAELLIRAAEHPALAQEEQVRLLSQAALDLTGLGVRSAMKEAS